MKEQFWRICICIPFGALHKTSMMQGRDYSIIKWHYISNLLELTVHTWIWNKENKLNLLHWYKKSPKLQIPKKWILRLYSCDLRWMALWLILLLMQGGQHSGFVLLHEPWVYCSFSLCVCQEPLIAHQKLCLIRAVPWGSP